MPEAKNAGAVGTVENRKREGQYCITFQEQKKGINEFVGRLFGAWWVDEAINGRVLRLPVVNLDPVIVPRNKNTEATTTTTTTTTKNPDVVMIEEDDDDE